MVGASVRRGIAAGLVAGVLAGLIGLVAGTPAIEVAEELEHAGEHGHVAEDAGEDGFTRAQQKAGLVLGSGLAGLAVGALFGVAAAWATGRVTGDAWRRSLKLGAGAVGAVVLLPMAAYPPNPPGVGDPDTVGLRSLLHLGTIAFGLLLAVAAGAGARELARTRLSAPAGHTVVGVATLAAAAIAVAVLPATATEIGVPASLLWDFRLGALATQLTLFAGTAVLYGLLASRAERPHLSDPATLRR